MKCFSGIQKPKRRPYGSERVESDLTIDTGNESDPIVSPPTLTLPCAPKRSFKSRVRAIQNAQRFIHNSSSSSSSSSSNPRKLGRSSSDDGTIFSHGSRDNCVISTNTPMPLPSPPSAYRLPLPREHVNRPSSSKTSLCIPTAAHTNISQVVPTTTDSSCIPSSTVLPLDEKRNLTGTVFKEKGSANKILDSRPLPLPKVPVSIPGLSHFTYAELASACHNFSSNLRPSYGDGICFSGTMRVNTKPTEIVAVLVHKHSGFLEMVSEISLLGRQHGPHFCKLIGYSHDDGLDSPCVIVYKSLLRGSLNSILFDAAPALDWPTRIKIALGAAHAIKILHETYPEKSLYCDVRTSHIQVDEDYTSKLVGYKFDKMEHGDKTKPSNPRINAYIAPETIMKGEVTLKSHVWSFGVILLEILSGKQHMDEIVTKDEKQNLVKWAKPFLNDDGTLFLVMDPKLQGKFPSRGARLIGDLVLSCLEKDPVKRPSMKEVLEIIKSVHEARYKTTRFPSKETSAIKGLMISATNPASMSSPLSANVHSALMSSRVASHGIRSPDKFDVIQGPQLRPLIIPSRGCASTYAMEDYIHHHHHPQPEYQSAPLGRISGF